MPVSYMFEKDGVAVALASVDDEVREYLDLPADDKNLSWQYQYITDVGLAACWSEYEATEQNVKDALARADRPLRYGAMNAACVEFLTERYTFKAWR